MLWQTPLVTAVHKKAPGIRKHLILGVFPALLMAGCVTASRVLTLSEPRCAQL